jgi:hypothetical protein
MPTHARSDLPEDHRECGYHRAQYAFGGTPQMTKPPVGLSQFALEFPSLVMLVVITLLLNDHVVHDQTFRNE